MQALEALNKRHNRSAIYQTSNPSKRYWGTRDINSIPTSIWFDNDWKEFDPQEDSDISLLGFND